MKLRKVIISIFATGLLLGSVVTASANTLSRSIGGVSFSAYSTITSAKANSGTTSSNSSFLGKVSSTYTYMNSTSLVNTSTSKSAAGYGSNAVLTFNAPSNCVSIKISSSHEAYCNNESWKGSTSASRV